MSQESDKAISKEKIENYGWRLGEHNHSTPLTSHIFYIRDFRFKHTQIFTASVSSMAEVLKMEKIPRDECVNFIGEIMRKVSKHKKLNDIERRSIVPVLINYTIQTKNYEVWRTRSAAEQRLHLIINIYRDKTQSASNAVAVRPFIVEPEGIMHSAKEILGLTQSVYEHDRRQNSSWFTG